MRRDNISPKSCLYCCEDHFNVKEDASNYIQYIIMKQQREKINLRLKKGGVPHIFLCQKRNLPPPAERMGVIKRQRLTLVNEALSELALKSSNVSKNDEPSQISDHKISTSSTNIYDSNQPGPSTSPIKCEDKFQSDKAVQVNIKPKYRSKGVNVNITTEKQNVALSPLKFPLSTHNIETSPVKLSVLKRKCLNENADDNTSISSFPSISADYQQSYLSESSEEENDSENEKHFKNVMRSSTLTAIEREPKMLLGLPKQSYHLVKLLSDNIPLPTKHILITLKKIKLNESFSILALQFGYSQSNITRIFSKSIPLIAAKLKDLIVSPASDIYKNLPISFRCRYANVVSIIDCQEIQTEKPSDAIHQSLTWSQYKKCNTLKYLISCTPDGLINFISDGYGGRATDVMIVQDNNYLKFLSPNKAVMADRGFKDLSWLLEAKRCTLIRPPSVSKSTPSTKDEVKLSKRIAALRIHVERVINRLREFHMLLPHASVDHNLIPIIDYVIIVACGLVNMQDVLIKK